MTIYLAGSFKMKSKSGFLVNPDRTPKPSCLESFYYLSDDEAQRIKYCDKFILDSGAFTFFSSKNASNVKWEEYVDRYADFIVRNDIKNFFELDIDKLVGYEKVLELRRRLEKKAERPSIPVWHKFRGKDNYLKMCDQYGYVAIGGIVSREIMPSHYGLFPWFIDQAHKRQAKIHGLGFTSLKWLPKCHFDSVDSTAWISGQKFGHVYAFNGETMVTRHRQDGERMAHHTIICEQNFNEWIKFQKWAEVHL